MSETRAAAPAAASSALLGTSQGENEEQKLSKHGAEDEEQKDERRNSCSRRSATGGATVTASERLIRNFLGSREVMILKLSAANGVSEHHPGSSPPRWWMHAAVGAKYVFMRWRLMRGWKRLTHTDTHTHIMNSRGKHKGCTRVWVICLWADLRNTKQVIMVVNEWKCVIRPPSPFKVSFWAAWTSQIIHYVCLSTWLEEHMTSYCFLKVPCVVFTFHLLAAKQAGDERSQLIHLTQLFQPDLSLWHKSEKQKCQTPQMWYSVLTVSLGGDTVVSCV